MLIKKPGKIRKPKAQLNWGHWNIIGWKSGREFKSIKKIWNKDLGDLVCGLCEKDAAKLYVFFHDCRQEQKQICENCLDPFLAWNDSSVLLKGLQQMFSYYTRLEKKRKKKIK